MKDENTARLLPLSIWWDELYWWNWSDQATESLLSLRNKSWMGVLVSWLHFERF
jgi:hypothetical protein